ERVGRCWNTVEAVAHRRPELRLGRENVPGKLQCGARDANHSVPRFDPPPSRAPGGERPERLGPVRDFQPHHVCRGIGDGDETREFGKEKKVALVRRARGARRSGRGQSNHVGSYLNYLLSPWSTRSSPKRGCRSAISCSTAGCRVRSNGSPTGSKAI